MIIWLTGTRCRNVELHRGRSLKLEYLNGLKSQSHKISCNYNSQLNRNRVVVRLFAVTLLRTPILSIFPWASPYTELYHSRLYAARLVARLHFYMILVVKKEKTNATQIKAKTVHGR
ncbi:hypothetical protein POJ06DRAFT_123089 [Lipomyces tetrasporus]|uniref:Uncharacterized protein n=1 Tax=Lipomyces tetrasporus TaxID=54092 RepID=A0AAD7QRP7_9ASCO|nr:uncharacterized protein POJ06DRAFT_123089 [Lipomyces tetrasporus]KAJ8100068.1 hypothetical protein POJ06DRAFT_123089 [Lipomyces tetrasporus]